jgi:hypothetical protein
LLIGSIFVILAVKLSAAEDRREFETGKTEYEQGSSDETARLTYVTELAQIADRLVGNTGVASENDELLGAINSELQKHPAPKDIDSKKLSQLLVSKRDYSNRTIGITSNANTPPAANIGFTTFSVSEKVTSILRVHERSFSTTAAG